MNWKRYVAAVAANVLVFPAWAQPNSPPPAPKPAASSSRMVGVKIAVADFDRAIAFYTLLGMKLAKKSNPLEWELGWDDPTRGVSIYMVRDPGGRFITMKQGGGFIMVSVPDVLATGAQFEAAGYKVGKAVIRPSYSVQMIEDPDGNQLELVGGPPRK